MSTDDVVIFLKKIIDAYNRGDCHYFRWETYVEDDFFFIATLSRNSPCILNFELRNNNNPTGQMLIHTWVEDTEDESALVRFNNQFLNFKKMIRNHPSLRGKE